MMRLGAVILKVEPRQVAELMWYFPLLEPYVDHVPIKADLSDLEEKIAWCRANDEECKKIAANCLEKYNRFVARDGLLDYIEMMTKSVASRQFDAPPWWEPPPVQQPPPQLQPPLDKCMPKQDRYCSRCQHEVEEERTKEEERKAKEASDQKSKEEKKLTLRERQKKRAEKLKAAEKAKEDAKKRKLDHDGS
jgi:Glycosyl transferase family 90